jgi:acid phosphatase
LTALTTALVTALVTLLALVLATVACGQSTPPRPPLAPSPGPASPGPVPGGPLPRPDHVVVVVLENHGPEQVLGTGKAPYLDHLAATGADLTGATAITHPSQPNYLALFSGDTQGVTDDSCPRTFDTPNLAGQLIGSGHGFAGYAEDLPDPGFPGCQSGGYVRWHSPWADFSTVPSTASRPFSAFGTQDFAALPTVSFVIPTMCHNMHDCAIGTGDAWLRANLDGFVQWAATHNSLLVVTFDEAENGSPDNRIPLILAGPMVRPGVYPEPVDHYRTLRTLQALYGLPPLGHSGSTPPLTDIWRS